MSLINDVKKKREFSELPDSVVGRVLGLSGDDVKESRKLLRKYFGVFLTNRVMRFARSQVTGHRSQEVLGMTGHRSQEVLGMHMSSKKRDYNKFYEDIFSVIGDVKSVVDLGCGVNGFSYRYLPDGVSYVGVEAVGQLVDLTNDYFKREGFDGKVFHLDLFDVVSVKDVLRVAKKPRVVFMFQVVDALESLERDFSKGFILEVAKECEWIVLSLSLESLGGRRFESRRKWLMDFLDENFLIKKSLASRGEKIIILKNKK